ncbi:hypothetical protein [Gracilibacillus thailandensis]|uniref:Uncharacterized protein n=1 Tax=Gracilibacillus thailandensis TaxID=563735 RepID=A0A6N7R181_9BACI|nr:hypothetical protein [Gracilibacillus thailandensis]MRI67115.1 hypothetical protein [Gracilibacillus thailandensis]
MLIVSLLIITILSTLTIARIIRLKDLIQNSSSHVHIIIMTVSMISSLCFGIVLGILFMHDLVTSSIVATLFGLLVGFVVGIAFHPIASLGGMAEGVMGGVMGAMTGEMIHMTANSQAFLGLMAIVFLVFMISLHWILTSFRTEKSNLTTAQSLEVIE